MIREKFPCSKCSKLTAHASGKCRPCRKVTCRVCENSFDPGVTAEDVCSYCLKAARKMTEHGTPDALEVLSVRFKAAREYAKEKELWATSV